MMPTRAPCCASETARFTATVDFPTPPLPLETAMTWPRSGYRTGRRRGRALRRAAVHPSPGRARPAVLRGRGWRPIEFPRIADIDLDVAHAGHALQGLAHVAHQRGVVAVRRAASSGAPCRRAWSPCRAPYSDEDTSAPVRALRTVPSAVAIRSCNVCPMCRDHPRAAARSESRLSLRTAGRWIPGRAPGRRIRGPRPTTRSMTSSSDPTTSAPDALA